MPTSCKQTLSNSNPCKAHTQRGKDYCFRHDPANNEAKMVASIKGGRNRALQGFYGSTIKLETPEDVKRFLGKVINAVWSEGVPVPVGSSMGFLTRCWLDAYDASNVVKRLDEIEEKISKTNV
ncbi:MAG: hypothetical protein G01um10145_818 [Microgenomates group bacterium Gr01-1014_5]|nr:MAG: hypothetical protein G01um10145_818 [Microgenomates group bacterium Gr01-1014_5]